MSERPDVPRSRFISTWNKKTTFNAGELIPFLVDEILPGDHMRYDVTAYLRMATPIFPLFDTQRIDTHIFFVPNRLLWVNWKKFMGQQDSPSDSISFTLPVVSTSGNAILSYTVYDYYGIPLGTPDVNINALPFRAYRLIYQDWFRDENLVTGVPVTGGNGPDAMSSYTIWKRAKSHDYFTSCLPWPQKFTAPEVPIQGLAPVSGIGTLDLAFPLTNQNVEETTGGPVNYPFAASTSTASRILVRGTAATQGSPEIYADLSAASLTVESLREAFQMQRLLERDARGGTRYIEMVKAHFGVTSPDARMQRPEYIGGGSTPLNVTPIAQSAPGSSGSVGSLGAAATAIGSHRASYAATEHGYIIGLISVKSELSYQQGIHKMFTRSTRYDFYFPAFAQLGEQAVLQRELYSGASDPDAVFGYQERWHEYRVRYSEVTAAFRSGISGTLDAWHLAQFFSGSSVSLGQTFIEDTPPMERVLAAGEEADHQQYFADIQIKRDAVRPLPMFSTPVSLGRF